MIVDNGKYYLYRHIRLDTSQVFYVGFGTKNFNKNLNTHRKEYERAYNKSGRSKEWKEIVNVTDYIVEIIMESNDALFLLSKEKEFVKIYGRVKYKQGSLVNIAPGGCTIFTPKIRYGKENHSAQPVLQYDLEGNFIDSFETIKEASIYTGIKSNKISNCICLDRVNSGGGFIWKKYTDNYPLQIEVPKRKIQIYEKSQLVVQYDINGNFIKEHKFAAEAARYIGVSKGTIYEALASRNYCRNSIIFYKKDFLYDKMEQIIEKVKNNNWLLSKLKITL